jgi:hypothetical protein
MAALVLSVAGAAAGSAFGPAGAIAGRIAGALAGSVIDQSLFGPGNRQRSVEGPRLADLDVMASTEGAPVARVYGRARLAGQVIWATKLEEVVSTRVETTGGGGGGKGFGGGASTTTTTTTYSYFANFAVGLAEGKIGRVGRIWADGKPLDLSGLLVRSYDGSETQTPDPLIVAKEGAANAPAYRGLAYVVFERLPLENFGNRIPQLSFEIVRPVGALENAVRAVTLIPGTTDFGYDTASVVRALGPGQSAPENRHVTTAPADVIAALDDLQAACPNLERVAVVVAWFGTDLRAGHCEILPGVDSAIKETVGGTWSVAGVSRGTAHLVSTVDGRPAFGGTPSDSAVLHLIAELKARGLKVTLYPFVMMDIAAGNALPNPYGGSSQPAYPWRGRITCDPAPGEPGTPDGTAAAAAQVEAFFGAGDPDAWRYRRFVLHYANLAVAAGGVDAFVIGSELKGLTRVRSASGVYPAVNALAALAADVKAIVGSGTLLTYAADWTEYGAHVVDPAAHEVRFPLDTLWASSAIDAVGIDYYAPLADWRDGATHLDRAIASDIHERAYLSGNLRAGEAYDWFYASDADRAAQLRAPITDGLGKPWLFRAKDFWSFWSNAHYERVAGAELATPTAWVPQGKPIWLIELGCPAVDKGANQPSVFPDAKSSEGGLPHFSNGGRDDLIQRRTIEAVLARFDPELGASLADNPVSAIYGGRMIDVSAIHLWTWDARPYPVFPAALDVWSDGPNWETGHWLTGRLGSSPMAGLVTAIAADAGVDTIDADALGDGPDGYVIDRPMSPRAVIEPLALTYAFSAAAEGGIVRFRPRGGEVVAELGEDDLVLPERGAPARLVRAQESELPREVSLGFTDGFSDYRRSAARSRRLVGGAARMLHADLAAVMDVVEAERRADIWLQDIWAGLESAEFALPPSRLALTPGDTLALTVNGRRRLMEVREAVDTESRKISARSIDPEIFGRALAAPDRRVPVLPPAAGPVHVVLLDLPTIENSEPPVLLRAAIFADPWPGPVAVWRSADGATFTRIALASAPSIIGETLDDLPAGPTGRFQRGEGMRVRIFGGALASVPQATLLAGSNAAAVMRADGAWEVIQFGNAELVGERTYRLTQLLRGQAGSEQAMGAPLAAGAPFVLLDEHVVPLARGLDALGRPMTLRFVAADRGHGDPIAVELSATPQPTALKPLAPVHLAARRTGAGISITWVRRTRRDGDSWDIMVPLGEDSEAYEVDILSGATVVRTLSSPQPGVTYAAADEIADFGSAQTNLTVRVAQLSAAVGRGFAAQSTLIL